MYICTGFERRVQYFTSSYMSLELDDHELRLYLFFSAIAFKKMSLNLIRMFFLILMVLC